MGTELPRASTSISISPTLTLPHVRPSSGCALPATLPTFSAAASCSCHYRPTRRGERFYPLRRYDSASPSSTTTPNTNRERWRQPPLRCCSSGGRHTVGVYPLMYLLTHLSSVSQVHGPLQPGASGRKYYDIHRTQLKTPDLGHLLYMVGLGCLLEVGS